MVDHAIFSKDGPNLNNPADTSRPSVIPNKYKLKKRKAKGRPSFNNEIPNNGEVNNIAGIKPIKALINDPTVLLLDEPTASLDPETGDFVRSFLEDYKKEKKISVLLASHNMEEVKRLCSSVLMMKDGLIVDRGTPEELITKYGRRNLEEVFLEIARK